MSPDTAIDQCLPDEPEQDCLLRLSKLVGRLFHVPVAYMALLGTDLKVITRIGSGSEYWDTLRTYPLAATLAGPVVWQEDSRRPVGFLNGKIKFLAAVPLRSSDGLELGVLVIADLKPRPEFSKEDHETLGELASVLAGKMELRLMAFQATESERSVLEAELRFRSIADAVPVMIIYSGEDGGTSFVNAAWLEFTGRSFEEELADGYEDLLHPDDRERVIKEYWDALHQRKSLVLRFRLKNRDGEFRMMEGRGRPRVLDNGIYAGYIACLIDLTDQQLSILDLHLNESARRPAATPGA
ncbi:MAG TPA: PAS domain-containing protein [Bryobacteraceae bacterium]|jgi:PAS domain S-box-containing protein|nr:PAS domain-containing protein [Bryobacteraceae bacterium]